MRTTWGTTVELAHRTWPLVKIGTVMYATAVGTLWAAVRALSPTGQEFSLVRGVVTAFAMTIVGNSMNDLLSPTIGHWGLLLKLAMDILIVKINFSLPFWRAALVGVIYFGVIASVYYLYAHGIGVLRMHPHKVA